MGFKKSLIFLVKNLVNPKKLPTFASAIKKAQRCVSSVG